MSTAGHTAKQLAEALTRLAVRNRTGDPTEWGALAKIIRRLEHEPFVRDVLPDLGQRVDAAEG